MSKTLLFYFLLAILIPGLSRAQSPNTWTQRADVGTNFYNSPSVRRGAASFSIGSKGYVCAGYGSSIYLDDLWEYDTLANTWSQRATLPGGSRRSAVGLSIGSLGYVGGGIPGYFPYFANYNDFWEYNPATNTWTQRANIGGAGRESAVGFSIGKKGFVGTGYKMITGLANDFWEYDQATDTWVQRDTLPRARAYAVGFEAGGKGYIGTGDTGTNFTQDFYAYDTSSKTWSQKASLPGVARSGAIGFGIGSKGYIGLGRDFTVGDLKDFWEYNTVTDSWTQKGDCGIIGRFNPIAFVVGKYGYVGLGELNWSTGIPVSTDLYRFDTGANTWDRRPGMGGYTSRRGAFSFSIGEKGYIGAGRNSCCQLNDFWEYDQQTGAWSQKADAGNMTRFGAVAFAIGGKGYMGTGDYTFLGTSEFWEYNPATNVWTKKGNFPGARRYHAVGFSVNSKGYVGTGYEYMGSSSSYFLLKDFWEYNPATDTWTQKADFGGGLRERAIGFSINNKGYIGMGLDGTTAIPKSDFWEYNPSTDAWTQKANFSGGGRSLAPSFSVGNKGYVGTGESLSGPHTDWWEYNSYSNTWTQKTSFPTAAGGRIQSSTFVIGNKGYVSSGVSTINGAQLIDNWEYTTDYLISTGSITGAPFCSGATVSVPYTKNGSYFAGNVFTAQLSDRNGSFANPVNIGTLIDTNAGTITATIPPLTLTGAGYRIRVVSSSPQIFGTNNGANIAIIGYAPQVTISALPGNTICSGTPVAFNAAIFGGGTSPAYVWKVNGATVGTGTSYTSAILQHRDTVTCVVTSNHVCATTPAASTPIIMAVTPSVTPAATISANPGTTICAGDSVLFSGIFLNGGVNPVYSWRLNGIVVATTPTYGSRSLANNDTIDCVLTSNAVCATTTTASSAKRGMTVYPKPNATVTASRPTALCAGDSVLLSATPFAGQLYTWIKNGSSIATGSPSYASYAVGTYKLAIVNSQGCKDTSASINVTVNPLPVVTLSPAGPLTICQNGGVLLTATSTVSSSVYSWLRNGLLTGTSGNSYIVSTGGTYVAIAADNIGCSDTSQIATVSVVFVRTPAILYSSGILSADTIYAGYQWYHNGTPIIGAKSQTFTVNQIGSYTLSITDQNGCVGNSSAYYVASLPTTGIMHQGVGGKIEVYPNPVQELLYVATSETVYLELLDMVGRTVMPGTCTKALNLSTIPSGVYMLRIADVNGVLIQVNSIVKQ